MNVRRGEAPLRRSFGAMRNGQIFDSSQWDEWENWSNRKVISKCEPMRMMITVFARSNELSRPSGKREHPTEEDNHENIKKQRASRPHEELRSFEKELFPEEEDQTTKETEATPEVKHVEHGEKIQEPYQGRTIVDKQDTQKPRSSQCLKTDECFEGAKV